MMEWLLETMLVVLLAATLFHARRLERALGVLKRDRAALEELVASFNSSTSAAELGIERLRAAAEGAGRQVQRQIDAATGLKDDLIFLTERGERLADRLDVLVRAAKPLAKDAPPEPPLRALNHLSGDHLSGDRQPGDHLSGDRLPADEPNNSPRLRSQAERDLLRALRTAR